MSDETKMMVEAVIYAPEQINEISVGDVVFAGEWVDSASGNPSSVSANTAFSDFTATQKSYVTAGTVGFSGMTFSGMTNSYGGALRFEAGANVTISGSTFSGNSSEYGGGFYSAATNLTVIDTLFDGNHAATKGGGVIINGAGTVKFSGVTFSSNTSKSEGAALQLNDYRAKVEISGTTFATASDTLFASGGSKNHYNDVTFTGRNVINASIYVYCATINASDAQLVFDNDQAIDIKSMVFVTPENAENSNSVTFSGSKTVKFTNADADVELKDVAVNISVDCLTEFVKDTDAENYTFTIASGITAMDQTITVDGKTVELGEAVEIGGSSFTFNFANGNLSAVWNDPETANIYAPSALTGAMIGGEMFKGSYVSATVPTSHLETRTAIVGIETSSRISFKNTIGGMKDVTVSDITFSNDYGALKIQINTNTPQETLIFIDNSKFLSNYNTSHSGGAIGLLTGAVNISSKTVFSGNTSAVHGGAIFTNDSSCSATVSNALFTGNIANSSAGAYYINGIATIDNAVFSGNSCKTFGGALYNGGTTTITGSTFTGNIAGQRGGAIFTNSILNLKDSLFIENTLSEKVNTDYSGGALSINSSSKYVTISGSTFASNTTGQLGGAINSAKDLTITRSEKHLTVFTGNSAGKYGGALYNSSVMDISGAEFTDNISGSGGAVYNGGTATLSGVKFIKNFAADNGGAFYGGTNTLTDLLFSGNTGKNGGAIYNDKFTEITGTVFSGNTSTAHGGAIYNSGAATITGSTFTGNTSAARGGAIYSNKTLTVIDTVFANNGSVSTNESGGAIIVDKGTATVTGCTFSGNKSGYGALFAHNNDVVINISGSTFATASDYIHSYAGVVNFTGTNVMNAQIINSRGAINLTDSVMIFDNDKAVNIAGMTFYGSNTLKLTGAQVNFTGLDVEDVTIVVNGADLTAGAVVAAGVSGALDDDKVINNSALYLAVENGNLVLKAKLAENSTGSVYGGGSETNDGTNITQTIASGLKQGTVFAGSEKGTDGKITTTVTGGEIVKHLYGGGKVSADSTKLTVEGGTVGQDVYGGLLIKNATDAISLGESNLTVSGGTFNQYVVGGSRV
ncbi:MAG: hypothetical protein IKA71_03390, partial [Lentisphaeria bacterium]|nr:hypothetical protein [Lentisphaeria bacterium]